MKTVLKLFLRPDVPIGVKIALASIGFGVFSVVPLVLYVILGPADGNPIGLGLLAVLGMLLTPVGVTLGLICLTVECLRRRTA